MKVSLCMPVMLFESESSTADMHHVINSQTLKALLHWHCLSDLQRTTQQYALCARVPCQSHGAQEMTQPGHILLIPTNYITDVSHYANFQHEVISGISGTP